MCSSGACSGISCNLTGAGRTNCGSASESCCTSLAVAGGSYYRAYTSNAVDGGATAESHLATVSGFRLDKYIVTVGRFRQFVAAWNGGSGWTPPAGSGKHLHLNGGKGLVDSAPSDSGARYEFGWQSSDNTNIAPTNANLACNVANQVTWTATAGSNENLPIDCVNWYEAQAFCIWDGGFLPSEAEYEYASAGGSQQREYPWGSTAPGTSNQFAIYGDGLGGCYYPTAATCPGVAAGTAPVGTAGMGAGRWGQLDLVGEAFQFDIDWYNTYADPCTDCAYLTLTGSRVIRGNRYDSGITAIQSSWRSSIGEDPAGRLDYIGFRCVRTP
jgi:formylglycine-generating enzyme required for sulfatase activity